MAALAARTVGAAEHSRCETHRVASADTSKAQDTNGLTMQSLDVLASVMGSVT
jgi:hypothetical protein